MKKLKILSVFLILAILICTTGVSAHSNNLVENYSESEIDAYLLESGFPQQLVDTMSDAQKEIIYQHSDNQQIEFAGYETYDYSIDKNNNLSLVEPCGGLISESDLTISVFGTRTVDSSGTLLYSSVYPSFVWNKLVKVKNDSFSMSMYSGWEAIPGQVNLRLHLMSFDGVSRQYVDLKPTTSSSSGYSFKIPSNTGAMQGLYSGYAYYDIDKKSSSATPRISLHYVYDDSSSLNISYGITIGVGSISMSGSSNKLYVMSGNYTVSNLP